MYFTHGKIFFHVIHGSNMIFVLYEKGGNTKSLGAIVRERKYCFLLLMGTTKKCLLSMTGGQQST